MAMTEEGRAFARAHIVEVYEDKGGEWRWRRKARGNGATDSTSGEAFANEANADRAARTANPFMEVITVRTATMETPAPPAPAPAPEPATPEEPEADDAEGKVIGSGDVETKPRKPTRKRTTTPRKKPAARKKSTTRKKRT